MKALSIRPPWTGCIVDHDKRVENRPRRTNYRGVLLIHASKTVKRADVDVVFALFGIRCDGDSFRPGGIVGVTEIIGCDLIGTADKDNPWASGPYLWRLGRVQSLKFYPCLGQLSMFEVDYPHKELLPSWAA